MSDKKMIQMMEPRLIKAEKIIPYLQRIDQNRWYSNFGPLVEEYEQRLSDLFGCHALSVSNCTDGITAALLALDLPKNSIVALPAWTFIATATAVLAAGHLPYFVDVDDKSWGLLPETVKRMSVAPKAVIPVSVMGAPVDTQMWDAFSEQTGIPAVIDAAGAFDAFSSIALSRPRKNAVVISTHATKTFGTGEGGMVLTANRDYIERIKRITNFGFTPERNVHSIGFNGKLSEYAAAVALASLDEWPQKRQEWFATKDRYLKAFESFIGSSPLHSKEWVGSLFNIRLNRHVHPVMNALRDCGIASRQVWGEGIHRYKAYQHFQHGDLTVTEALGDQVLFVPYTIDIPDVDLAHIAKIVKESVA